jgi:hypothetical protein
MVFKVLAIKKPSVEPEKWMSSMVTLIGSSGFEMISKTNTPFHKAFRLC